MIGHYAANRTMYFRDTGRSPTSLLVLRKCPVPNPVETLSELYRGSNIEVPTRCTCYKFYFIRRLLYMFRVSLSPIFRSTK